MSRFNRFMENFGYWTGWFSAVLESRVVRALIILVILIAVMLIAFAH